MNVKIYFNKQRMKADGSIPISIAVTRSKDRFYISTGLFSKTIFDNEMFPRSESNFRAKTIRLQQILTGTEDILLRNPLMPVDKLKNLIRKNVLGQETEDAKTLSDHILDYSLKCKARNTQKLYRQTAAIVKAYDGKADFNIGASWLEQFCKEQQKTKKTNTVSLYLRNIRTVFNWAITNDLTTNYPFRKFKIPHEKTIKRNLSIDTLKELRDMELKDYKKKYRDVFMLMFYLIGINAVDLLLAKKDQIINGRLVYIRSKTHKLYSIRIEKEAQEIIDRYAGDKFLLKFCENSVNYLHFLDRMDVALKTMIEGISSYFSRHSWATIAYSLDVPKDIISQALGHNIGSDTTSIYIENDQKKVDEANRKVLDALL